MSAADSTVRVGSWSQVVQAYYAAVEGSGDDAPARRYHELREGYERTHGTIQDEYFCTHCVGSAVLTRDGRLESATGTDFKDVDPLAAHQVLFQCEELVDRVTEFLPRSDRMPVLDRLYAVVGYVLGSLDELVQRADGRPAGTAVDYSQHEKELAFFRDELARVEERYLAAAARGTQVVYFKGMLLGACYLAALAAAAGVVLVVDEGLFPGALLAAAVAGGLGGIVSVMWRMTQGKLTLDPESGLGNLRRLGSLRPIIGAIFALALFVLAESGIVPLERPGEGADAVYFYAALGFIAGFSERFAQDMLAGGEQGLSAGTRGGG